MPSPAQPPLHPGTGQPIGPDDLAPLFPMELIGQEVSQDARDRDPGGDPRHLQPLAPDAALPGAAARAGGRDALADLLQVRGRQPARQPQAEHRGRAGVLQREGGPDAALDRDRRRPVGLGARLRLHALRARVQGLHGQDLVRPEAVPALADPGLGRGDRGKPVRGHAVRTGGARGASRLSGQPRDRDLGGGRGRSAARGHRLLARLRAEPRPPAPDGDRAGGDPADGAGRRLPGRRDRLRRRRVELRRDSRSRSCARRSPAATSTSSPASRPPARRSRAASSPTTSATRAS